MKIITKKIKEFLSTNLIQLLWNSYDEGYQNVELDDYQFIKIEQLGDKQN